MKHHRHPSKLPSNILSNKALYLMTFHCQEYVRIWVYIAMWNKNKSKKNEKWKIKLINYAQA